MEEEIGDDDHRHAEPAAQPADERTRQIDERIGHAAPFHDRAGKNEAWDCQQDPILRCADEARSKRFEREAAAHQPGDGGGAKGKDDRHPEDDKDNENDPGGGEQHDQSPPAAMAFAESTISNSSEIGNSTAAASP